jgi:type III restriction enzyme
MANTIDQLIINSPYKEPQGYWSYDAKTKQFNKVSGRRPAGYYVASPGAENYNDPGIPIELPLVNDIRKRIKAWKENSYPGITPVTRKLLEYWYAENVRNFPFFFCQLDAIETIIWLTEARDTEKNGIDIKGDGGDFKRICTKLCTGGGKTTVMAMLIAWQVCNKAAYPKDARFTKYVFIVAPGLTVRERLQVLDTGGINNYYNEFQIVPPTMLDKLHQGKVKIENWQSLAWDSIQDLLKKKSVDKRGPKNDEAYARQVLGELAKANNILVINDEAHHAWRKNPEIKDKYVGVDKKEEQEATIWVSGLDRIHKARSILTCYDFSATPFAPSGKRNEEEALFTWIVSDFSLNDGIESGLVKTPRMVVRDDNTPDAKTFRSKLYHLYADKDVKDNISRPAKEEEPLPDLVIQAYNLLGADWLLAYNDWLEKKKPTPPVMITVTNRTETASRVEYAFKHKLITIEELCDEKYLLHIDSKELEKSELNSSSSEDIPAANEEDEGETEGKKKRSKKEEAQLLRKKVNTVGQIGEVGEQIRNIVSVAMLTEGWDAKTVTHIMGLRAFSSQLLCEQVVGRGLRRSSYDIGGKELYEPEYVNIFGIPFSFLPHEGDGGGGGGIPKPTTEIKVMPSKAQYEITWPNVIRINHISDPRLYVDFNKILPLTLDMKDTRISAEVAPFLEGKPDLTKCAQINFVRIQEHFRMQKIIFDATAQVYAQMDSEWKKRGTEIILLTQIYHWVERYLNSNKIIIEPVLFMHDDPVIRKVMYMLNMNKIVTHLWQFIDSQIVKHIEPELNPSEKTRSTASMRTWYTTRPCEPSKKSHISHIVYDSAMEATEAYKIENNPHVIAYAKNDHIGFCVYYTFNGIPHTYYPDFLIKLDNSKTLVLETKGQDSPEVQAKRAALSEWVEAVNSIKEYGQWCSDISYSVADVDGIIGKYI